jgi:tetratricopeptide (TPR) repeat protein
LLAAGCFACADTAASKASGLPARSEKDAIEAVARMETASRCNPFKGEYNLYLAGMYELQGKDGPALRQVKEALKKNAYSSNAHGVLARLYIRSGQYEEAAAAAERALSLAPYQAQWYDFAVHTYYTLGYTLMAGGKKQQAEVYLTAAAAMEKRIEERVSQLSGVERKLWNVAPMLAPTPKIYLYSGASLCLSGDYGLAVEKLTLSLQDPGTKGEACIWLSIIEETRGDREKARAYSEEAAALVGNYQQLYEQHKNVFNLQEKHENTDNIS